MFVAFVSLLSKLTDPDIDANVSVLFSICFSLLLGRMSIFGAVKASTFHGFISFVRVFLCKSYIVHKETTVPVEHACSSLELARGSHTLDINKIARMRHWSSKGDCSSPRDQ